jgi:hypothetical protein
MAAATPCQTRPGAAHVDDLALAPPPQAPAISSIRVVSGTHTAIGANCLQIKEQLCNCSCEVPLFWVMNQVATPSAPVAQRGIYKDNFI